MDLEKLFLTKEELPILNENCFQIPIHPKLLDSNIHLDKSIAKKIFPQVAKEWREDLKNYLTLEKDLGKREWYENAFLKKREKIKTEYGRQSFGIWEDNIWTEDNGFVRSFSINRNVGGTIYFNPEDDILCKALLPNRMIKFSEEKSKEFEVRKVGDYSVGFVYAPHNVDYFPGALFLRNWAIKYMNEVFREIFK